MSGSLSSLQTGTLTVSNAGAGAFPTGIGYYPSEGSRVITLQYQWQNQVAYSEDLSQLVARGVESTIQTVWVDNSTNSNFVQIYVPATGHVIVVPAFSQGLFPIFFTGTPAYQVSTSAASATVTRLSFLNVSCAASGVWNGGAATAAQLIAAQSLINPTTPAVGVGVTGLNAIAAQFSNWQNFSGAGITTTIKVGPGRIFAILVVASTSGSANCVGDSAAAPVNQLDAFYRTGTVIIGAVNSTITFPGGLPFFNGLTLTWDGAATGGCFGFFYS